MDALGEMKKLFESWFGDDEVDDEGWVHLRVRSVRPYLEDLRICAENGIYELLPSAISDDDCVEAAMAAVAACPLRDGVTAAQAMAEALTAAKEMRDYYAAGPPPEPAVPEDEAEWLDAELACLRGECGCRTAGEGGRQMRRP